MPERLSPLLRPLLGIVKTISLIPSKNDVTRTLSAIDHGDQAAVEELLPIVYQELRKLTAQKLSRRKPGHFFRTAAEAMRRAE